MDPIYTIYKATNIINGKCYIGFTSVWPKRIDGHIKDALVKNSERTFCKAIRKYTPDCFVWTVLYQSKDKKHTKNVMEKYFIAEFNSNNKNYGYNMTAGGDGIERGYKWSDETKARVSARKTRPKTLSEEHKKNISKSVKGQKLSPEACANISAGKKGIPLTEQHKQALRKPKAPKSPERLDEIAKDSPQAIKIVLDGIEYVSKSSACRKLNITWFELHKRLKAQDIKEDIVYGSSI